MRKLVALTLLVLSGCAKPTACMLPAETGTVASATDAKHELCGRYGNCTEYTSATVLLTMPNGTSRLCSLDNVSASLLKPGQRVSLSGATRLY